MNPHRSPRNRPSAEPLCRVVAQDYEKVPWRLRYRAIRRELAALEAILRDQRPPRRESGAGAGEPADTGE